MVTEERKTSLSELLDLGTLGVLYNVDESVRPLVTGSTLRAARLVVDEIRKEINKGLPVVDLSVQRLDDYDAGLWSEVMFLVKVHLDSKKANEWWDKLIGQKIELTESQEDELVKTALSERISIQFRWY